MLNHWHVNQYAKYLEARTRPARDLLASIPSTCEPKIVYDLGCGPGNSTILLQNRWPESKVIGIDSSLEMLDEARKTYPDIDFVFGDIQHLSSSEKIDCLFANASLQWLDNHDTLLPQLLKLVSLNGILAIQMPNNFHAPSHQVTIDILQSKPHWQPIQEKLRYRVLTQPLYQLPWYYDLLTKLGLQALQLWETEYFQEMSNHQAIFDWVKGTGLRPVLAAMDEQAQKQFTSEYIAAIAKAYPIHTNGKILLPFKRIFMVGKKSIKRSTTNNHH